MKEWSSTIPSGSQLRRNGRREIERSKEATGRIRRPGVQVVWRWKISKRPCVLESLLSHYDMLHRFVLLTGCLGALACGASEEKINRDFDEYVSERNGCDQDSYCSVAWAGCPLGCYVYVHASEVSEVEEQADKLIRRYERGGQSCNYTCVEPVDPICVDGICTGKD